MTMSYNQEPKPIALEAYEALAESYAALVDTKPHNAYYERPATLSLLPAVAGKQVLDAGCGPGVYAEWLAKNGAEVVAFDVSAKMVQLAKERVGAKARVLRADLELPLDFLKNESFDIVLSSLAMEYVREWEPVFSEFCRVLRRGGHLVFSVEHPSSTFVRHVYRGEGNYFRTELVYLEWCGFEERVNMPSYRRPLGAMINPLLNAGFVLERILEPQPTELFKQADPESYERLSRMPGFLCVRAMKR